MDRQKDTGFEAILEHLIEHGANDLATVFARAFELAMRIERQRFLGAGHYERRPARHGYANRQQAQADRHARRHCRGTGSQDSRPPGRCLFPAMT